MEDLTKTLEALKADAFYLQINKKIINLEEYEKITDRMFKNSKLALTLAASLDNIKE